MRRATPRRQQRREQGVRPSEGWIVTRDEVELAPGGRGEEGGEDLAVALALTAALVLEVLGDERVPGASAPRRATLREAKV